MNFEAYIDKINRNVLTIKTMKMVSFYIIYTYLRIEI